MTERIRFYAQVAARSGGIALPGRGASMGC